MNHDSFIIRKPRKDKRKGEKFTGAQGSDQGKSENFDYSNRVTGAKEAAAKVTMNQVFDSKHISRFIIVIITQKYFPIYHALKNVG